VSDYAYQRLTSLDRSFLLYEGPTAPMHVGATGIFEAGPLRGGDGTIELERLEQYVLSRLHRIPRYRQRLATTPIENAAIWVDDPHFNVHYHVRHTRLPRPGDERQLKRAVGRILSQHLDRGKPLWEMWLVEGLEGDRVALVTKVHHCMVDGVSGVDLLSALLSPDRDAPVEPPHPWLPRPAPSAAQLARDRLSDALRAPLSAASGALDLLRDRDGVRARLAERLDAVARFASRGIAGASSTSLNQPVGPYRRIDWLEMELPAMKRVAKKLGGTLNDVVLATAAGGLRGFLKRARQEDVDRLDLRAAVPVSTREAAERGKLGNRVAAWLVKLPVGERDPLARFEQVRASTAELKASKAALAADTLEQVSEWTGATLLQLGARLMDVSLPINLVITNVPGPRQPLFLLGAEMLAIHPMVPLFGHLATGIALMSYRDVISWGFSADWDLVPDLHDLVLAVDRSFRELREAAGAV
jgi:WS/DGAT/MGAT family acyltransferase